jgi:hypothetical protein
MTRDKTAIVEDEETVDKIADDEEDKDDE